ncbi:IS200/IS605 family transposase [Desulfomonile tiedjei]|uniref:Transposase n=1 Tax=Desulfomonile tiedjei (strain ATCC 49306 / DSM 6799 / DCB-1) TaxID=706587 RepID=I4C475_DESTA|nr:IS200/IS605 family transposase [Desulfomonile tiedjei]AFM24366.1 transposase [Desulfomonile tiedjei DSM 6799]
MSTYTQILYHIVFSTKGRAPVLVATEREAMFRYIWGIIRFRDCHLYRVNGTLDHIHILIRLHPTQALSNLIREIKVSSSNWIKTNRIFTEFSGWQAGYGAFTHSEKDKERLILYIKNQEQHHKALSFGEELRNLLNEAGIQFDEKYLLK